MDTTLSLEDRVAALEEALGLQQRPTRSDLARTAGDFETTAPAWVPEHDYSPDEDRSVIRALRSSQGVVDFADFLCQPVQPQGWQVVVGPGRAVIDGSVAPWVQGSYVVWAPSSVTLDVQPASPTLARWDVVILHLYDEANSTEEGYGWQREVVTGTPGSGALPALPPNSLPILMFRVRAGDEAVINHGAGEWREVRRSAGEMPYLEQRSGETVAFGTAETVAASGVLWGQQEAGMPPWPGGGGWPFPTVLEVVAWGMYGWGSVGVFSTARLYFYRSDGGGTAHGRGGLVVPATVSMTQAAERAGQALPFVVHGTCPFPANAHPEWELVYQMSAASPNNRMRWTAIEKLHVRQWPSVWRATGFDYDRSLDLP